MLRTVFGQFHWTPPGWLRRLGWRRFLGFAVAAIAAAAAVAWGLSYYESLPKPATVVATVDAPGLTPIVDDELRPEPLTLHFKVTPDPRFPTDTVDSVAALDRVGQVLTQGVSLIPALEGEWRWADERRLVFTPAEDWPAGQRYVVRYDASIFAPNLRFDGFSAEFTTEAFHAGIRSLEFYQDPVDTKLRKVVATLEFSHPIDRERLGENLSYAMRPSGATIRTAAEDVGYEIRYDEVGRHAYVHSDPIELPPDENFMTLTVAKGLAAASGPSRLDEALVGNVRIPDVGSYFRVSRVEGLIARDKDDDPVQSVMLTFTDRVQTSALQERITAYLLPRYLVRNGRETRERWRSPREVTPEALAMSDTVAFDLAPVEGDNASIHSAVVDLPAGRLLYVKVDSGLTSEGEFVLSRAYDTLVRLPDYPKEARIAQSGALLPLSGSHELTFLSRGVNTLKVEIGRLLKKDVNHLASQTGGDIANPYFNSYQFGQDNLSSRVTRYIDLASEHPRKAVYASLDLSEYLSDGGYYFINVQGWDRQRKRPIGSSDRRFVLITDIGLLVKANADSTQDVFVHSIASGQPLAGASIELLGKNGIAIASRTSSADGHAAFPSTDGFDREQTPTVFVVRNGNDSVFMPYGRHSRMLQYSRFDTGGIYSYARPEQERLSAQVFSDRGIYRPGDAVNLAAIVKRDDWQPLAGVPLLLRIVDPRGQVVLDRRLRLPEGGLLDERFETLAASPTGNYGATLFLIDDDERRRSIGSTGFRVEEFQPDRLRIQSRIVEPGKGSKPVGWLKPEQLENEVRLENLFGTPAQGRRISAQFELLPTSLHFPGFEGFVFEDPLRRDGTAVQPIREPLPDTSTDKAGIARVPLPLDQYTEGVYRLNVLSEGFEQGGGRSVKARASVIVSPLDHLLGHKANAELGYLKKDSEHSIEYVAVDSNGSAAALGNLTLSLMEYQFVSSLVQRPDGTFAYESIRKETTASSRDFALEESGGRFVLPTTTPGQFAVKIENSDGLVLSKVDFSVAGSRNVAGTLEENAELDLKISATQFAPGDEIELEITAPYTGAGLITIERDRVYAHKWIESDTTTSVHSIRVPENLEGNAYVNVAFVRALDSPEIYTSPLSYAAAPFNIDRDKRQVEIELAAPDVVRPGTTLQIEHRASRPARIIVYAIDEGILQVARYEMPDPLRFFLPKMALQVATYQLVDLILPEFSAYLRTAAPGGGEAAGLAGSNLNPFRRKGDAPVAFWSGVVDSGPDARSVAFEIPDYFNGQLRIMAVAAADSAVGRQQISTIVRAPFVITPNVLTAAAPGDEFEVNVGVANNLEQPGRTAAITLTATVSEHLEVLGSETADLDIVAGDEARATFRVRALDRPGPASLSFTASSGEERSRIRASLSVRPPVAYVSTVEAGTSSADTISLRFERELYSEFGQQTAAASTSPLVFADGLIDYLDAFPHACTEQIVSKVFPQIGFLSDRSLPIDEAKVRALFAATVDRLRSRQGPEGGFRFWMTSVEPAHFPSAYAVHFLTDARELGLPVPRDVLDAGLAFLTTLAAADLGTLAEARLRAYAIYLLTRSGQVTTNYLTALHETLDREYPQEWRADLTAVYMAASYALLREQRLGDELIRGYRLRGGQEMLSDFDTRLGRDAQYLYVVSRHFPDRVQDIDGDTLEALTEPVMQNRFNTLSSAYTILALGEYTRAVARQGSAGQLTISAHDGTALRALAAAAGYVRADVATANRDIEITHDGGAHTFYVLSQTGFDRQPPDSALSEGIELHREYLDDDGNPVTELAIGQELTVRLRVRSTGRLRSNVAVVDLLPGGFEILTESVRRHYGGWSADYFDVREDRVVVYGNFSDRMTEINYRVKATSAGSFTLPAAFAGSMYDRTIQARTRPGRLEVEGLQ